jgi:hypothetical protein
LFCWVGGGALKGDSSVGVGGDDGDDIFLLGFYFIAKLSRWGLQVAAATEKAHP